MMKRKAWGLIAAMTLAGCAGSPIDVARKHEPLRRYAGDDAGYIVASKGDIKSSLFSATTVTFQRHDTDQLTSLRNIPKRFLSPFGDDPDFDSKRESGVVIVTRLPPGDYELQSAQGVQYGTYEYRCTKKLPPVVRFTVRAGEVTYLGRYIVTSWRGNCLSLTISDEQDADLAVARTKVPSLPASSAHSAVPAAEARKL